MDKTLLDDTGFESKFFGVCQVNHCIYEPGQKIATAPCEYWTTTEAGKVLRFGCLGCVLDARRKVDHER